MNARLCSFCLNGYYNPPSAPHPSPLLILPLSTQQHPVDAIGDIAEVEGSHFENSVKVAGV